MPFWDTFDLARPGPKYRVICDAIAEAIDQGILPAGRRLPSHRLLAERLGVAVGTITRAYEEALRRGLVAGEIGRGTYVKHRPLSMRFSVVDDSRIPSGVVDLYQNLPVAVPEVENRAWSDALEALRRNADLTTLNRASWSEVPRRSQQAASSWMRRVGFEPPLHNILEGPGTQSVLAAAVAATAAPGAVLLAPYLSHPAIKLIAEWRHVRLHGVAMDDAGIDPAALDAACRQHGPAALYLSPTIHPPTTLTMPEERRAAVVEVARRHDLWIIEDESAAFLLPDPPAPVARIAPERTLFVADPWMALSLGLRTTWIAVPDGRLGQMASSIAATGGVAPPPLREIAATWIESGVADELIEARRAELVLRNRMTREILGRRRVRSDPYGHHVWVELPEPWRSDLFVVRAELRGVAVVGADLFFVGDGQVPAAIRICIGNAPDRDTLRGALEELDRLMDEAPATPANLP